MNTTCTEHDWYRNILKVSIYFSIIDSIALELLASIIESLFFRILDIWILPQSNSQSIPHTHLWILLSLIHYFNLFIEWESIPSRFFEDIFNMITHGMLICSSHLHTCTCMFFHPKLLWLYSYNWRKWNVGSNFIYKRIPYLQCSLGSILWPGTTCLSGEGTQKHWKHICCGCSQVVGPIPYNLAPSVSYFLRREYKKREGWRVKDWIEMHGMARSVQASVNFMGPSLTSRN